MYKVLECVSEQHALGLVLLAAAICTFSSFSFFFCLGRSEECGGRRRRQWYAVAAVVGGVGVWATHFVAMLAYDGPTPITYDVALTAVSVAVAIALFWLSLLSTARLSASPLRWIAVGAIVTVAVGAMHMTGMAAIIAPVRVQYDLIPLLGGLAVAGVFFALGFVAFATMAGRLRIITATLLMVIAVCLLHFTGMSATTLVPDPTRAIGLGKLDHEWLVIAIVLATSTLAVLTGAAAIIDRYLTDLRGLAEATLEGLAIIKGDRIVEANDRFGAMLGVDAAHVVGGQPDQLLLAADGLPAARLRRQSVEARPINALVANRTLEIATHAIEYRGRDCTVLAVRDLTEKKNAQMHIEHMARHDALTGLANRVLLHERITLALASAGREKQSVALVALDLDRFKAVNDIFGHAAGDEVLCRVTAILENAVRSTDTVARVGGDEFVILQVGAPQPEGARALAQRILADFASEMDAARDPTAVGASIGVAVYPNDAQDADGLKHGADVALYKAKSIGRGTACFFDLEMDAALRQRRALEHDLRHAILRRQMRVVYQPLVTPRDGAIAGYEALLRWEHPDRGDIPPEVFVPVAEEVGAIVPLGEWVLRQACRDAAGWDDHLTLAVNVSPVQFQVPNLVDTVSAILREEGLRPDRLELEITETVLMKDRDNALRTLRRLKAMGVRIVMDDFGTGYSSLSNLQSFPFDKMKIDRSFVSSIEDDEAARSIIRAIVAIGKSLHLPVVAEGVETEAQRRMILEEGCPQAQGFLFGRPGVVNQVRFQPSSSNAA